MKIGILTLHSVCNFGANLQAYASSNALQNMGHNVRIIDFFNTDMECPKDITDRKQNLIHRSFVEDHLPLTSRCYHVDDLIKTCGEEKFDYILVGSDAVFLINARRKDIFGLPSPFYCDWIFQTKSLKHLKVSSLAASSMGTLFSPLQSKIWFYARKNLNQFSLITVRDSWTKYLFSIIIKDKSKISICPDPVSSLKKSDIEKKIEFHQERTTPYLLFSASQGFFEEEWINKLISIAHLKGYEVGLLPTPESYITGKFDFIVNYPITPFEWFLWITNSKGYIGMRFHPIVVSLFNGIPFVALDHYVKNYYKLIKLNQSSKTFDLCHRYEYLDNWFDIRSNVPSPEMVFDRFINFNINSDVVINSKQTFYNELSNILF